MTGERPNSPDPRETQAISDITTLAFWGIDFQPCDDDLRQRVPESEKGNIFESKIREKDGYDHFRKCEFTAVQVQGMIYNNDGLEAIDLVLVYWHDGHSAAVNSIDLFTEQRTRIENDEVVETGSDPSTLISEVKTALAQLVDIAS